ncbi:MAG: extracellular solute-binding protein [Alphaproteobacteria bacterium]|nr:extracellular solute-binding protein [Alphaproteobacteria bacterium]
MKRRDRVVFALAAITAVAGAGAPARAASQTLTIFAAGTLAVPFKQVDQLFEQKYPTVEVQPQFGGSVKMARQITDLHRDADILAVADYNVIPKYLFGGNGKTAYTDWYVGFARNAITFVYTDQSKFARQITPQNWYRVLARKGVEIGRSNPNTDPSGYQTVQMLSLAEKHYRSPGLAKEVLANAPLSNMRDTETSLISALQLGQIDYLAIYRSDALQHHLKFLNLPVQINLSDPKYAAFYAQGVAHTKNGDLTGKPIVYAITIVANSPNKSLAEKYIAFLLGPAGRKVLSADGFGTFAPAYAVDSAKMPGALRPLVKPWPNS